jgi:hypothetical protein
MADVNIALEDRAESYWKTARVLRVLAWTSIVWGCLVGIYTWTGLKAGSDVWLIWAIAQFVAGGILLVAAAWMQHRAARALASVRLEAERSDRVA